MAKTKYKVRFLKYGDGQQYFERSFSVEQLEVLFVVCDGCEAHKDSKKFGSLLFKFARGEFNSFCKVLKMPLWLLKKFVREKDWIDKTAPVKLEKSTHDLRAGKLKIRFVEPQGA